MTNPAIIAVAHAIDPDIADYGDDHERTARAIERGRHVLRELANARLPYTFMHGGVTISVDPRFVSMVRSMLLEVAK